MFVLQFEFKSIASTNKNINTINIKSEIIKKLFTNEKYDFEIVIMNHNNMNVIALFVVAAQNINKKNEKMIKTMKKRILKKNQKKNCQFLKFCVSKNKKKSRKKKSRKNTKNSTKKKFSYLMCRSFKRRILKKTIVNQNNYFR